jgi:hypothetical protein
LRVGEESQTQGGPGNPVIDFLKSHMASAYQAGYTRGDLGTKIMELFQMSRIPNNFSMYINGDLSSMNRLMDSSLTSKSDFKNGWYEIAPNRAAIPLHKSLKLNSTGTPVTIVNPD